MKLYCICAWALDHQDCENCDGDSCAPAILVFCNTEAVAKDGLNKTAETFPDGVITLSVLHENGIWEHLETAGDDSWVALAEFGVCEKSLLDSASFLRVCHVQIMRHSLQGQKHDT